MFSLLLFSPARSCGAGAVVGCARAIVTVLVDVLRDETQAQGLRLNAESYCYGARTSGRSPWWGDTARRRFIGGGRGPLLS